MWRSETYTEATARNFAPTNPLFILSYDYFRKLAIFVYDDDSVRVVVSSANLYQDHWEHFNHW